MTAIGAAASLSFLAVPMAIRDLILAKASSPPTAARCLLMISAPLSLSLSSAASAAAESGSVITKEKINFVLFITSLSAIGVTLVLRVDSLSDLCFFNQWPTQQRRFVMRNCPG